MKQVGIIAERYAEAFLAYVRQGAGMDRAIRDLQALRDLFRENPDFETFLMSPQISLSEKTGVVDTILGDRFSDDLKHFLKLLLVKYRMNYLPDVFDYVRTKYAHGDTVEAVLKTTYPLDMDVLQNIKNKLESKVGKKLNLYIDLDPDLLGGIYVRIGNKVFDGSIRKRLEDLRAQLKNVQVK